VSGHQSPIRGGWVPVRCGVAEQVRCGSPSQDLHPDGNVGVLLLPAGEFGFEQSVFLVIDAGGVDVERVAPSAWFRGLSFQV
jgi:hypothetical protein